MLDHEALQAQLERPPKLEPKAYTSKGDRASQWQQVVSRGLRCPDVLEIARDHTKALLIRIFPGLTLT